MATGKIDKSKIQHIIFCECKCMYPPKVKSGEKLHAQPNEDVHD